MSYKYKYYDWRNRYLSIIFVLVGGLLISSSCQDVVQPRLLMPGETLENEIDQGERHSYLVELEAGKLAQIEAEEHAGDIMLILEPSAGAESPEIDYPEIDSSGDSTRTEEILVFAESAGLYQLQVLATARGSYSLRLGRPRDPDPRDRQRAAAHRAFYRAREHIRESKPLEAKEQDSAEAMAEVSYLQAISAWQELGEEAWGRLARAWFELAELRQRQAGTRPEWAEEVLTAFETAEGLAERAQDRKLAALASQKLGARYSDVGEVEQARDAYQRSLDRWLQLGLGKRVFYRRLDLATVFRRLRRPDEAREQLLEALELAGELASGPRGSSVQQAEALWALGEVAYFRGERAEGISRLRQALQFLQPDRRGRVRHLRAAVLTSLAAKLPFAKDANARTLDEALTMISEALELRDPRSPEYAMTLNSLGLVLEQSRRSQESLDAFRNAAEMLKGFRKKSDAAVAQANACRLLLRLSQLDEAQSCFLHVLEQFEQSGLLNPQSQVLYGLAEVARRQGRLEEASVLAERALQVVELIRGEVPWEDKRAAFLASRFPFWKLPVDLALTLHRSGSQSDVQAIEQAFYLLERSRARGFLDLLVNYQPAIEPREQRELRRQLSELAAGSPAEVEGELTGSAHQRLLQQLAERLHSQPVSDPLLEPPILTLEQTQHLLEADTVMLSYHLGERFSAVWVITPEQVELRWLAPKREIESAASALYRTLSKGAHPVQTRNRGDLAAQMSELVLGPVAPWLDRSRLVVIPDGTLSLVPFAALPFPGAGSSEPLIESHQIVSIPSASVLAQLRERQAARPLPVERRVAILASPVFNENDPRLPSAREAGSGNLVADAGGWRESLPYTAQEAKVIARLAGRDDVLTGFGFSANREFICQPSLEHYRYLHFATHTVPNRDHGELFGLVLSQFDRTGRPVDDGVFWAYELYGLKLNAELVVLSACQTALGEDLPGEGPLGLTRGFLYAGAQQVLVTLWDIADQATAEMMEEFYGRLIGEGRVAAEALQLAQQELRKHRPEPFYWAPFVLQGDWQASGGPAVESAMKKNSVPP